MFFICLKCQIYGCLVIQGTRTREKGRYVTVVDFKYWVVAVSVKI